MNRSMPTLDLTTIHAAVDANNLDTRFHAVVDRLVGRGGKLRSARPEARPFEDGTVDQYGRKNLVRDYVEGCAAYVWRNVTFYVSPDSKHHSMPTLDFCYIPTKAGYGTPEYKALEADLNKLVDIIVDTVPVTQRHGVNRWRNVFSSTTPIAPVIEVAPAPATINLPLRETVGEVTVSTVASPEGNGFETAVFVGKGYRSAHQFGRFYVNGEQAIRGHAEVVVEVKAWVVAGMPETQENWD